MFRNACSELGRLLIYEAVRDFLPTVSGVVDSPLGPADVTCVDPTKPIKVQMCVHVYVCVCLYLVTSPFC
jgi:uracil phosphoribosyltransferase